MCAALLPRPELVGEASGFLLRSPSFLQARGRAQPRRAVFMCVCVQLFMTERDVTVVTGVLPKRLAPVDVLAQLSEAEPAMLPRRPRPSHCAIAAPHSRDVL